jgi:hypothetical protein
MGNTDEEQLKDQLEHELDETQFLDLCQISFRELIDMVFEQGVSEELRSILERAVR